MAEKKKAGVKLGWHNPKARKKIIATKKRNKKKRMASRVLEAKEAPRVKKEAKPREFNQRERFDYQVAPLLKSLRHQGLSFEKIAQNFNQTGVATRQGGSGLLGRSSVYTKGLTAAWTGEISFYHLLLPLVP